LGGLLLFFLRIQLLDVLRSQTGVDGSMVLTEVAPNVDNSALDIEVLNSAKFISLKNNVNKFDFENICEQGSDSSFNVVSLEGEVETSQIGGCVLGNNVPFFLIKD